MKHINPNEIVGEVLTNIDVDGDTQILLTTESGRQFLIYHDQDCCEEVSILSTEGDWYTLLGKEIVELNVDERPSKPGYESRTDTTLTFKVSDATVINRWVGESNGYYSESVDFAELPLSSQ